MKRTFKLFLGLALLGQNCLAADRAAAAAGAPDPLKTPTGKSKTELRELAKRARIFAGQRHSLCSRDLTKQEAKSIIRITAEACNATSMDVFKDRMAKEMSALTKSSYPTVHESKYFCNGIGASEEGCSTKRILQCPEHETFACDNHIDLSNCRIAGCVVFGRPATNHK